MLAVQSQRMCRREPPDRSERLQFIGERVASAGVPGER
jgi:hypothetical protein